MNRVNIYIGGHPNIIGLIPQPIHRPRMDYRVPLLEDSVWKAVWGSVDAIPSIKTLNFRVEALHQATRNYHQKWYCLIADKDTDIEDLERIQGFEYETERSADNPCHKCCQ